MGVSPHGVPSCSVSGHGCAAVSVSHRKAPESRNTASPISSFLLEACVTGSHEFGIRGEEALRSGPRLAASQLLWNHFRWDTNGKGNGRARSPDLICVLCQGSGPTAASPSASPLRPVWTRSRWRSGDTQGTHTVSFTSVCQRANHPGGTYRNSLSVLEHSTVCVGGRI